MEGLFEGLLGWYEDCWIELLFLDILVKDCKKFSSVFVLIPIY